MREYCKNCYTKLLTWLEGMDTNPWIVVFFSMIISGDQRQGVKEAIGHINVVQDLIPRILTRIQTRYTGGPERKGRLWEKHIPTAEREEEI